MTGPTRGPAGGGTGGSADLDQELPVLLDVLVGRLLLLFLLRLHRHVDVHPQLLAAGQNRQNQSEPSNRAGNGTDPKGSFTHLKLQEL